MMMMRRRKDERACHALLRLRILNAEQQSIYRSAIHRGTGGLTMAEKSRLHQIHRELAIAQDERNRARCGAPPAPPDYDPFCEPQIVENRFVPSEKGNRKTNEQEVMEMRRLYNEEHFSAIRVCREFPHLKESTVRDILHNRTWYDPEYVPRMVRSRGNVREVVQQRTCPAYGDA
jgi:hypothetical protein